MQQHNFLQGSPEWHAHRARSFNASDAPAMLGCSPYMTRSQLLHALHTGIRPEVTPEQQRRFDDGHEIEAAQRAAAETVLGEDLFPVVGSAEVDGVALSASFDGLTMLEDTGYECKTLNNDLRAALQAQGPVGNDAAALPKAYRVQMEQQLAVSGAERILFVAATKDGSDVRCCWYYPDPGLRAEIIAGWKQLAADLAAYVPPAPSAAERIVAEPVQALPAVSVQVAGQLTVQDNFRVFEERLRDFLEHRLIRQPKTDQDFADLDVQIKAMKGAEAALDAAEAQMLAQIQTVDQAKRTKDMLAKLVRDNRLMAEKLLASEKERRRGEIVAGGNSALKAYIEKLNERLGRPYMPATATAVDFGEAIKGKKSLASMEDAVATKLANAKIAANEIADRIELNLRHLREHAGDFKHLFPDTATIALKAPEDLQALVTARIAEHRAAEERRMEAERARIRAEEEARARELAAREQREREAAERRQREEDEAERRRAEQAQKTYPNGAPMFGTHVKENGDRVMLNEHGTRSVFCDLNEGEVPAAAASLHQSSEQLRSAALPLPGLAANVVPMPTKAPAGPPTLKLGEINARIAPLSIDAAGLASLGFPHAATEKAAKLYHEHDFPRICAALIAHLQARQQHQRAA